MFVLIHSPLIGPYSWSAVADELRQRGYRVSVPDLHEQSDDQLLYWQRYAGAVARTVQPEFLNAPTFPSTATFTQRPYSGAAADALAATTTLAVSAAARTGASIPNRLMCPSYPQAERDCTRPLPRAAPARGRA